MAGAPFAFEKRRAFPLASLALPLHARPLIRPPNMAINMLLNKGLVGMREASRILTLGNALQPEL